VHGLGILLIILVRIILSSDSGSNGIFARPRVISAVVRIGFLLVAVATARAGSFPWSLVCLAFAFPLPLVNLLVPAGLPNVTYWVARVLRPHSIAEEPVGGATFHELRARLHRGVGLAAGATKELGKRLANLFDGQRDRTVRGATITAHGMLDAVRGDWNGARELFDVVQDMRFSHAPRSARTYCQAWLLADAARRGAHHEVMRLARRGPWSFRRVFLRECARRLLGRPTRLPDAALVLAWLLAPARGAGHPLLKRALDARPRAEIHVTGGDLATATSATVSLLRLPRGAARRSELFRVARAWQRVLESGELSSTFAARREALAANFDVAGPVRTLETELTALFAELLRDSLAEDPAGEDEPLLVTTAKDALQSELLGELEELCGDLPTDTSNRFDGYQHHWRTWARVRAVARRFLDALPERRAFLYGAVGPTLLNHGAWLHNSDEGLLLAHDVFRFLLEIAPRDVEDYDTLKKNAAIGRSL
jgi:hypothetical protein